MGAAVAGGGALIIAIIGMSACAVIGVIGILAAIAIPNFLKFQCKAVQSEAKTNLSGLFTAEKAFYGEYGFYTSDLNALNWQPDGTPRYLYGFAYGGPSRAMLKPEERQLIADYDPERKDTSDPGIYGSRAGYSTVKMRALDHSELLADDLPEDSYVERDKFVAAAIGDVDADGSAVRLDIWTIDQVRTLSVITNDCAN